MPADAALDEADRARGGAGSRGWYEVYYVTAALGAGRAVWLRYTLLCPADGDASTSLWAVTFDAARPRWFAARTTWPARAWAPLPGGGVSVGEGARLTPHGCRGELLDAYGRRMRWDLEWRPEAPPMPYFPAAMERMAGGATFPIAAVPFARADGTVEVDGESITCAGVALQQSHLFGGRHARRWGWLHALGFDGDPDGFLTAIWAVPQRLGGRIPAASAVILRAAGQVHRSTGLRALAWRDLGGEAVRFRARAGEARLEGTAVAELDRLCGVTYHDPGGDEVWCANSEIATLTADLSVGGRGAELVCRDACGFERGARAPQPHVWRPL